MNLYTAFRRLIPDAPVLVGNVASSGGGAVVVTLPGGSTLQVRGSATVGSNVFIRNGAVEGPAPSFTPITIEV